MHRKQIAVIAAASLAALTACSSTGGGTPKDDTLVRVDAARATVPESDLSAAATSANAFGLDVFHAVADGQDGDIMVSPTSLTTVLAMLMPGAQGQTAAEMAATLHTSMPAEQFANALGAMNSATVQRVLAAVGQAGAGAIWDVLHPWLGGERTAATHAALAPHLGYVQVKDVAAAGDTAPLPLGAGTLPLADCLGALRRDGWDGWLCWEYERRWFPGAAPLPPLLRPGREHLLRLLAELP